MKGTALASQVDSEPVTFLAENAISAQEAARMLGLTDNRVVQLCQRGTLQARHLALAGRSPTRRRWLVEAVSVEQLVATRRARPPAKKLRHRRPCQNPTTVAGTLSASAAAKKLGFRADTIYHCLRRGTLRGERLIVPAWHGTKRCIRVSVESVEQFLARRSAPHPPRPVRSSRQKTPRPVLPDPWEGSDTLSVQEAAELLRRSIPFIYALCRTGRLEKRVFPSICRKNATVVRVTRPSVETCRAAVVAAAQLRPDPAQRKARRSKGNDAVPAALGEPGETSLFPPGFQPVRQAAEATGHTPAVIARLHRAGFIRGGVTMAGKVLIEVASIAEHQAASSHPAFWTPARTRRYRLAAQRRK